MALPAAAAATTEITLGATVSDRIEFACYEFLGELTASKFAQADQLQQSDVERTTTPMACTARELIAYWNPLLSRPGTHFNGDLLNVPIHLLVEWANVSRGNVAPLTPGASAAMARAWDYFKGVRYKENPEYFRRNSTTHSGFTTQYFRGLTLGNMFLSASWSDFISGAYTNDRSPEMELFWYLRAELREVTTNIKLKDALDDPSMQGLLQRDERERHAYSQSNHGRATRDRMQASVTHRKDAESLVVIKSAFEAYLTRSKNDLCTLHNLRFRVKIARRFIRTLGDPADAMVRIASALKDDTGIVDDGIDAFKIPLDVTKNASIDDLIKGVSDVATFSKVVDREIDRLRTSTARNAAALQANLHHDERVFVDLVQRRRLLEYETEWHTECVTVLRKYTMALGRLFPVPQQLDPDFDRLVNLNRSLHGEFTQRLIVLHAKTLECQARCKGEEAGFRECDLIWKELLKRAGVMDTDEYKLAVCNELARWIASEGRVDSVQFRVKLENFVSSLRPVSLVGGGSWDFDRHSRRLDQIHRQAIRTLQLEQTACSDLRVRFGELASVSKSNAAKWKGVCDGLSHKAANLSGSVVIDFVDRCNGTNLAAMPIDASCLSLVVEPSKMAKFCMALKRTGYVDILNVHVEYVTKQQQQQQHEQPDSSDQGVEIIKSNESASLISLRNSTRIILSLLDPSNPSKVACSVRDVLRAVDHLIALCHQSEIRVRMSERSPYQPDGSLNALVPTDLSDTLSSH